MNTVRELIRLKGHQVRSIQKNATIVDAGHAFLEAEVSSLLVYDGDRLAGIFTKNDLVRCSVERSADFREIAVSEGMTTELFTTTPGAKLQDVFTEMLRRTVRHVPVMDNNQAIGMITSIDILVHQKEAVQFENEELMRYVLGRY